MAEKYELYIEDDTENEENQSNKNYGPRPTKKSYNSLPKFLKDSNKNIYDRTKSISGNSSDKGNSKGSGELAIDATAATVSVFSKLGTKAIKSVASNIGNFTSNQANQNTIDNISSTIGDIGSGIGSIAAGAAVGGPVGAIAAAALVVGQKALDMSNSALELAKTNKESSAVSQRNSERLGYIETGYSR